MNSMTGYATGRVQNESYVLDYYLTSINRKNLDINFSIPKELYFLEERSRKLISSYIARGQVFCKVNCSTLDLNKGAFCINEELLQYYTSKLQNLSSKEISLEYLLSLEGVVSYDYNKQHEQNLLSLHHEGLSSVLEDLLSCRKREGKLIQEKFIKYYTKLISLQQNIQQNSSLNKDEFINDLLRKFQEYEVVESFSKDRIVQEAIIIFDKMDTSEEIIRLEIHLKSLHELLNQEDKVGKKIEFLIQELNREINTISSKAKNILIKQDVLEFKNVLEMLREQVLNIE